jgi:hypothetical protein
MNPYASFTADRNVREVIAETPAQLSALAATLGPEGLKNCPAPGKWTAREILCHLADTEVAFAFRLRQALAERHHIIQPFDQDRWAEGYANYSAEAALEVFSALRRWNIVLIESTAAEAFSKPVSHPERGQMTFQTIVDTMAGHDLNHRRQLETIAARAASA